MDTSESGNEKKTGRENGSAWNALGLAWELGYLIAVPLAVLALSGRFLDRWLQTTPWFLLVGIVLSLVVSTYVVYRKTINILKG